MGREIERKFLVKGEFRHEASGDVQIIQAYLTSDPRRTVRIRISGEQAYITIKGKSNKNGTERYEWENQIPLNEAKELFDLCEPGVIEKTRYFIPYGNHVFEVDEYKNDNHGLIVAEIELRHENEQFDKPSWLGEEVTGIKKYYNSSLRLMPFNQWQ